MSVAEMPMDVKPSRKREAPLTPRLLRPAQTLLDQGETLFCWFVDPQGRRTRCVLLACEFVPEQPAVYVRRCSDDQVSCAIPIRRIALPSALARRLEVLATDQDLAHVAAHGLTGARLRPRYPDGTFRRGCGPNTLRRGGRRA